LNQQDEDMTSGEEDYIERNQSQNNITQIITQLKSAVFKKASISYPFKDSNSFFKKKVDDEF
jgi:hypothetical protein